MAITTDDRVLAEPPADGRLPTLSGPDTARLLRDVGGPLFARGLIAHRPRVVRTLEALGADRRGVELLVELAERYGDGPLRVEMFGRELAVVVDARQVHEILDQSPEPFHPATTEKQSALEHFQPEGVLASSGPERAARRRLNEEVLESDRPCHHAAARFDRVVDEEARWIAAQAAGDGRLDWRTFSTGWDRVIRRVVLGDRARDDLELQGVLDRLRMDANWAFLKPVRRRTRRRLHRSLQAYLDRAEPDSLAGVLAERTSGDVLECPVQQFPQWLFAFDPAGMATFRTLALLDRYPEERATALEEAEHDDERPALRAAVLESLRLWPTTPGILRQLTADHRWPAGVAGEGTSVFVYTPYFHRHPSLPDADRFSPRRWLEHRDASDWPLVPFSGGPAMCPGRNVVLTTTSAMLASLHRRLDLRLLDADRVDVDRLPSTLDPYTLRFDAVVRAESAVDGSTPREVVR